MSDSLNNKVFSGQSFVLGTLIQLVAYGENAKIAIEEAIDRLNEIDDKMSVFKPSSEVSIINKNAGIQANKISLDTLFVIKKSIEYSVLTDGAIDITIRPLVDLWGIGTDSQRIPTRSEINKIISLVDYTDLFIDADNRVTLLYKNQAIDLGGIAKGYAADQTRDIFKKHKIKSALINLGGNISALGNKPDNTLWNIGIQNPLSDRGDYIGIISVSNKSVVTSGNYEKFFEVDGKRYSHLIDPRTGYPSSNGIISATIVSSDSIACDALTTAIYILGLEKSINLINKLQNIEAVIITEDKKIYFTPGIKNSFELTNSEFKLDI